MPHTMNFTSYKILSFSFKNTGVDMKVGIIIEINELFKRVMSSIILTYFSLTLEQVFKEFISTFGKIYIRDLWKIQKKAHVHSFFINQIVQRVWAAIFIIFSKFFELSWKFLLNFIGQKPLPQMYSSNDLQAITHCMSPESFSLSIAHYKGVFKTLSNI